MNYLELCQRLVRECGIAGEIGSVQGQFGEMRRVTEWIREANRAIQSIYWNWKFLHAQSSIMPTPGMNIVMGPDDLGEWDRETFYLSDGGAHHFLNVADYQDWRLHRIEQSSGRPNQVIIMPDNTLMLHPTPDDTYEIRFDYFRAPQVLLEDQDVPWLPTRYHETILFKAMREYGYYEAAQEVLARGEERYQEWLNKLKASQLWKRSTHSLSHENNTVRVE